MKISISSSIINFDNKIYRLPYCVIFKGIGNNWLNYLLEINNMNNNSEYGSEINPQLVMPMNSLQSRKVINNVQLVFFIDSKRTVDTLDLSWLLQKLNRYHTRCIAKAWFSNYLKQISQYGF